jgi:hypothetical protein
MQVTNSNEIRHATTGFFIFMTLIRRMANERAKATFVLVRIHGQRFPLCDRIPSLSGFSERSQNWLICRTHYYARSHMVWCVSRHAPECWEYSQRAPNLFLQIFRACVMFRRHECGDVTKDVITSCAKLQLARRVQPEMKAFQRSVSQFVGICVDG